MTQKSLTLKCITPNGTPLHAKNFAGICHYFYPFSSNSMGGSHWCLTLKLSSSISSRSSSRYLEIGSLLTPSTPHLLPITSFLLFLQLLSPLVRISLWNWHIFQVYFLTQSSALSVLYGYNYFSFKLSFLSHICTWFLFNLKGYRVKSTFSSHTSLHLKLSFPRDNYWTQFPVFFKTCSFLCGEIVIQFIEKCQLIGV